MPSVNLRLDVEQHSELVERAAANGRSLQREIVWMLFGGRQEERSVEASGDVRPVRLTAAAGLGVDVPAAVPGRREFRGPDPKGGRRGLGSGEVPAAGSPPVAVAAVSPEPSFRPDPKKKM